MSQTPGAPQRPDPTSAHQLRDVAESFGGFAEAYDRTRPAYPEALIERIVDASPGPRVLDVGCGTGIAARQFARAGCTVLGVDPDPRMAEVARRRGSEVEVGTFEEWEPRGRVFDAVVAGTAWHWVDPVAGAVKAAHLLADGGRLAPFHHVFELPPEIAAAQDLLHEGGPLGMTHGQGSALDAYQRLFDAIQDGIRASAAYAEPERWEFRWERIYTKQEWLDQLPTLGALTQLAPDRLSRVQGSIGQAVDSMGGSFTMGYTTVVLTATRA